MKCNVCQFEIEGEYKFCPHCGAGMTSNAAPVETPAAPAPVVAPVAPAPVVAPVAPAPVVAPAASAPVVAPVAPTPVVPVPATSVSVAPSAGATPVDPTLSVPNGMYAASGNVYYNQQAMSEERQRQSLQQQAEKVKRLEYSSKSTSALCACIVAIIAMLAVKFVYECYGEQAISGYIHAFRINIVCLVVAIGFTIYGMVRLTYLINKKFTNVRTVLGFIAMILSVLLIASNLIHIGDRYDRYRIAVNINKVADYYVDKNEKRESADRKMKEYDDEVERARREIEEFDV